MHVVISPNPYRDKEFHYSLYAEQILKEVGVETSICLPFCVDKSYGLPSNIDFCSIDDAMKNADMLLCLGGDGTILHASKMAAEQDVPILGVNIGTLGFMAELEASDLHLLRSLPEKKYAVEERMMLFVKVVSGTRVIYTEHALNDAVVTKGAVARVLQMGVKCNGSEVLSFSGDGVILSTPTGSTAYSLSAGGPIVEPTTKNILITPICAHGQNSSCFVTEASREIAVSIDRIGRRNAFLSVDGGRAFRLESTDRVVVSQSRRVTKLVKLKDQSFFQIINSKFLNR